VKKIFKCLARTKDLSLWYLRGDDFELVGYFDTNCTGYKVDRKIACGSC